MLTTRRVSLVRSIVSFFWRVFCVLSRVASQVVLFANILISVVWGIGPVSQIIRTTRLSDIARNRGAFDERSQGFAQRVIYFVRHQERPPFGYMQTTRRVIWPIFSFFWRKPGQDSLAHAPKTERAFLFPSSTQCKLHYNVAYV